MDSIYDILHRYDAIAEDIGPEQRAVKQLPALFKPAQTSPQLSGPYPGANATRGYLVGEGEEEVAEAAELSIQQLATISDAALDQAYGYGRSTPGNSFGWQANLKSAEYAKKMIDAGVTDIEKISDAIHKGWNVTAQAFVRNPDQFSDTEKLKAAGKLEAKLQQRAQLMKQNYAQLSDEEQEKDRVVARALLQTIKGQQGVAEGDVVAFSKSGMTSVADEAEYKEKRDKIYRLLSQPGVDAETKAAAKEQLKTLDLAARNAGVITEETATEDVLSAMKKKLGDYFQDVATAIKTDPDLKDRIPQTIDQIKSVKTITTDDGKEIKITGNEDDGFRISIRNQEMRTPFKTLDEATMACEMYCARRRQTAAAADYLDEA